MERVSLYRSNGEDKWYLFDSEEHEANTRASDYYSVKEFVPADELKNFKEYLIRLIDTKISEEEEKYKNSTTHCVEQARKRGIPVRVVWSWVAGNRPESV